MTRVDIDRVERRYGALRVLKEVSLDVESGAFAVLLGPSGCGKSTLLAAIAGLDPLDGGRIAFDGEDVSDLDPAARNIGMVFQSYALYPSMRVRDNLAFGLETKGVPRDRIRERIDWAATLLRIEPLLDRRPAALSGGQRQRVAIGRALVRDTTLFLFDEPLSNLDAKLRTEMRVEIKALHQKLGATFIYVTHDQIEAMTLATRIAIMNGGVIEQYAAPEDLYDRPATLFVAGFIGSPPMNLMPARIEPGAAGPIAVVGDAHLTLPRSLAHLPARDVVLGVRPEALHLVEVRGAGSTARSGTGVLSGALLVTEPLGSDTLLWLDIAGSRVAARVPPRAARRLSGPVSLSLAPDALSAFDPANGQRLNRDEPLDGMAPVPQEEIA